MSDEMPSAHARAEPAGLASARDVRAGGLLALGIRAMVALATSRIAPAAVAIGAFVALWGLPPR